MRSSVKARAAEWKPQRAAHWRGTSPGSPARSPRRSLGWRSPRTWSSVPVPPSACLGPNCPHRNAFLNTYSFISATSSWFLKGGEESRSNLRPSNPRHGAAPAAGPCGSRSIRPAAPAGPPWPVPQAWRLQRQHGTLKKLATFMIHDRDSH